MSFGGGREQYILEYVIKVTNQGGAAATGPINQVNQATQQMTQSTMSATVAQQKFNAAQERVKTAGMGVSKAAKGMAFGFLGIATAGAEAVGMLSMYQQTQQGVKDAQDRVNEALKEGGKGSKEYRDASQDLTKALRWQRMTQRNLMLSLFDLVPFIVLSVNGILKLKNALKEMREAKAAADALRQFGVVQKGVAAETAAANTAMNASGLTFSKYGKGLVFARTESFKFSTQAIKSSQAMGGVGAAMTLATSKMNTAATSTTRLSKAMRVLQTAMKIAIPLVLLEIGSQAFQNNWGGFADKMNALGVAAGNAIPQLKGVFEIIGKIGRSVVAIFTGNFDDISAIWSDTTQDMTGATKEMTDKQRKEIDKLKEDILDLNNTMTGIFIDAATADKKEKNAFLKSMGLDDSGRKHIKSAMNDMEKVHNAATGLYNAIATMRTLNLMQKFGIDVPNKSWKDIAEGLGDIFHNLGKSIPGDDMFDQFAKVMKKASKKKGPAVLKDMMAFIEKNPNFMPFLMAAEPDLAKAIQTMIDEAGQNADASGIYNGIKDDLTDQDWAAIMKIPENALSNYNPVDKMDTVNGKKTKHRWFKQKTNDAGPFQPIVDQFMKGFEALKKQISATDFTALGATIRQKLVSMFSVANMQNLGQIIRNTVINPILGALQGAFGEAFAQFKNNPIKFFMDVTAPIGALFAGLMGYASEQDMMNDFKIQVQLASAKFQDAMKKHFVGIDWLGPVTAQQQQADLSSKPGASIMDKVGATAFLQNAWAQLLAELNKNPTVIMFKQFLSDPIGWIAAAIGSLLSEGKTVAAEKAPEVKAATKNFTSLVDTYIKAPIEGFFKAVKENENVKILVSFFKGPIEFLQSVHAAFIEAMPLPKADMSKIQSDKSPVQQVADIVGPPIAGFFAEVQTNPDVVALASFLKDPIPAIMSQIDKIKTFVFKTQPAPTNVDPKKSIIQLQVIDPMQKEVDKAMNWWNGLTEAGKRAVAAAQGIISTGDFIKGLWDAFSGGVQKAEGSVAPKKPKATGQGNLSIDSIAKRFRDLGVAAAEGSKHIQEEFSNMWSAVTEIITSLAVHWTSATVMMQQDASAAANGIYNNMHSGNQQVADNMDDLAKHWSAVCTSFMKNASAAGNGIYKNLHSGFQQVADNSDDLAKHWSAVMNSFINNAKSAASGVNSALAKIKNIDRTITFHVRVVGSTPRGAGGGGVGRNGARGAIIESFATGGVKEFTTHGPELIMVGDNPGGHETIAAIPNNNPYPTIAKLNQKFIGRSGGKPTEVHIHNHLLERDVLEIINIDKGRMVSRMG